jgi:lysozyme
MPQPQHFGGLTNNTALLSILRHFEGERLQAYRDSENIPTIGIGATTYENGKPVKDGDRITRQRSEQLLSHHQQQVRARLNKEQGFHRLSPNARAAVESFGFNAGPNFMDSKDFQTIAGAVRRGDEQGIARALPLYDNGGTPGLVRRRKEEARLATKPYMSPKDSTLANDRTRKIGTPAILDGNKVIWGGKDLKWQSQSAWEKYIKQNPHLLKQQQQ